MGGSVDANVNGSITTNLSGDVDFGLDNIKVTGFPKLQTDSSMAVSGMGMDDIHIKELPRLDMDLGIKPMKVHLPSHYEMCFSFLGNEIFKVALCGETMAITEPMNNRIQEK